MKRAALQFPADESCDFAVVHALRTEGYDVLAVSEIMQRSINRDLIEQAHKENRILLTEDKDFGWLVFASHAESAGVILIRFPDNARQTLCRCVPENHHDLIYNERGFLLTPFFCALIRQVLQSSAYS